MTRAAFLGMAFLLAAAASAQAGFVTFDPDGSLFTYPTAVSDNGRITGWFQGSGLIPHGFVRDRQGAITVFDVPDAKKTYPAAINHSGKIVGNYVDQNDFVFGFLRNASGSVVPLHIRQSLHVDPVAINDLGAIAGIVYLNDRIRSFAIHADGSREVFAIPNKPQGTFAVDINNDGTIVGYYQHGHFKPHGFLRADDGTTTLFDVPGALWTKPLQINDDGVVTGNCYTTTWNAFMRKPDGSYTLFAVPGAIETDGYGTDTLGNLYGRYRVEPNDWHGFVRHQNGDVDLFDVPGATDTFVWAVNPGGVTVGNYSNGGAGQGFLRTP